LHMRRSTVAISTLVTIILILIAAIVGAIIAYGWTLSSFYLEPENIVDVIITNADFEVNDARSFSVTIMNPSHSAGDTNITQIYVTAPAINTSVASVTDPTLPFTLARGTTQTFHCSLVWGDAAGQTITVHAVTYNNTEAIRSVQTKSVKLVMTAVFNASQSVNYFNVSVTSVNTPINLTLNKVFFEFTAVNTTNLNIPFPHVIESNETINFTCNVAWEGYVNPVLRVETLEGYAVQITTQANAIVSLQVARISFSPANTSEVDVTLFNSNESTNNVDVSNMTFSYANTTYVIDGSLSNPALPATVGINQSVVFACKWDWNNTRNVTLTVNANTLQGFPGVSNTTVTPQGVVADIASANFDLSDTGEFSVNVTNAPYSLGPVNVTSIRINLANVSFTPTTLNAGQQAPITCSYNWSSFIGQDASVTVYFNSDSNGFTKVFKIHIPYLKVTNATFWSNPDNSFYMNVTVRNSEFSKVNATITTIQVTTNNASFPVTGSTNYLVNVGSDITIICPWKWQNYSTQSITVSVFTADGTVASATFEVP
jgi:hypothetical protein